MEISRVLLTLLSLAFVCSVVTSLKNDRGGSSFKNGPPSLLRNRRIALSEFLVPPPLPGHHSVRSGRVVNAQPTEAPGYISKFMDWFNPFNYGQLFTFHPTPPPAPPLHHPPTLQANPSLYPPPGPPPNQHPGLLLTPPVAVNSGPVLSPPPSPSLSTIYGAPAPTLHDVQYIPPPPTNNHGAHLALNKGKPCNPCNKVPWVPMEGGGLQSNKYPYPPPLSNGYLPPSNHASQDAQLAASHEIRTPDFSHAFIEQNGQPLDSRQPNPLLYPGSMPPLYKAEPFDRPFQSPHIENAGHFESPPLPAALPSGQEHKPSVINNEYLNVPDNHDLTSSGTQVNQGHVIPQNHGTGINKEPEGPYKESFGTSVINNQPPSFESPSGQEYLNPADSTQEHGGISNHPVQVNQDTITSFGSSTLEGHGFNNQNSDVYYPSFEPNSGHNNGLNYLPPNLNPPSFGSSAFNNKEAGGSNYQYSDDLSPSGSAVKNSHITTETPFTYGLPTKKDAVHFEESPLLDLTKKSESRTDTRWPAPTSAYIDDDDSFNTVKTTVNYLETDNTYFEDASDHTKPIESHASSNNPNNENIFGPPTPATIDFSENIKEQQQVETVSYTPPSRHSGYLWSSFLSTPSLKNESAKNVAFSDPLAQRNNSSDDIVNSEKQGSIGSRNANDAVHKQQGVKRNKQVQVIIPYTSEYTPIPFQQSYGDWSVKNDFERTQPRKVPQSSESIDNYVQQESRNEIRLINQLQSQFGYNDSKKLNAQTVGQLSTVTANDMKVSTNKANSSIDVRRLQKNIDNWTIQEYSKPTTSSTILPSSLHPYLLPSKKIPTEYLTTTEPGDHTNESGGNSENVKSYSLAGFSFNEVEHEGSASNRVEKVQAPVQIIRVESSKSTTTTSDNSNKSTTQLTWQGDSISISPVNKERIYVVTPQPMLRTLPTTDFVKLKGESAKNSLQQAKPTVNDAKGNKDNLNEFEAIEKAYQVLPQAVNNLAVASTGKEDVPLWGIMEHDVFASLNLDEADEGTAEDIVDRPVLYSGHSKVSRAKR